MLQESTEAWTKFKAAIDQDSFALLNLEGDKGVTAAVVKSVAEVLREKLAARGVNGAVEFANERVMDAGRFPSWDYSMWTFILPLRTKLFADFAEEFAKGTRYNP